MKTPYDRLAIICTNCTGHMTKMATTPIYGKNPLNIFSGTKRLMALVCSIWDVGPTRFAQMMKLTLTYFMARSNLSPNAFKWEKS